MAFIYHLIGNRDWQHIKNYPEYRAPSLESEGFIHFSSAEECQDSANIFYPSKNDLLLLEVDAEKLTAELIFEAASGKRMRKSALFPHLYGALNVDAVVRVIAYPLGSDGKFGEPPI
jgi:uncharacterized protein (DUF952 family)